MPIDLQQLYTQLLAAWQLHKHDTQYSQCVPVLLKPSNERSMDERALAIWCTDADYKGLGAYFAVLNPQQCHTAAEALGVFDIHGHYIFDSMFALTDKDAPDPLEAPIPFEQFAKLWTLSGTDNRLIIESRKATARHLPKAFPLVGAQLKKTPEGRALFVQAHHYFSGHRTKNGGKTKRRKAKVVPTYSVEEQDARYLGSWVWADMHKDLCKGGRSVPTTEVLDYIRGPQVPPFAKQKLQEHGVWQEFEELRDDSKKISVDHIVPHDWGATDHPMNYFLVPKGLNSQLHARGFLTDQTEEGEGRRVPKKQLVGLTAFNTAISFHRLSLAIEHGYLLIDEAMEIARKTAAGLAHNTTTPHTSSAPPKMNGEAMAIAHTTVAGLAHAAASPLSSEPQGRAQPFTHAGVAAEEHQKCSSDTEMQEGCSGPHGTPSHANMAAQVPPSSSPPAILLPPFTSAAAAPLLTSAPSAATAAAAAIPSGQRASLRAARQAAAAQANASDTVPHQPIRSSYFSPLPHNNSSGAYQTAAPSSSSPSPLLPVENASSHSPAALQLPPSSPAPHLMPSTTSPLSLLSPCTTPLLCTPTAPALALIPPNTAAPDESHPRHSPTDAPASNSPPFQITGERGSAGSRRSKDRSPQRAACPPAKYSRTSLEQCCPSPASLSGQHCIQEHTALDQCNPALTGQHCLQSPAQEQSCPADPHSTHSTNSLNSRGCADQGSGVLVRASGEGLCDAPEQHGIGKELVAVPAQCRRDLAGKIKGMLKLIPNAHQKVPP